MRQFQLSQSHRKKKQPQRQGLALLAILVLIMMLSLIAYSFTLSLEDQYRLARIQEDQAQAKLAAHSGIELVASLLALPIESRIEMGGVDNNPDLFQNVALEQESFSDADVADGWSFSVLTSKSMNHSMPGDTTSFESSNTEVGEDRNLERYVFGLQNESAKIHLPTLADWDRVLPGHARRVLESLPGATSPIVERLLRRINFGDAPASEDPQFQWLWWGEDLNRNFQIDPIEVAFRSMRRASVSPVASESQENQAPQYSQNSPTASPTLLNDRPLDRGPALIGGWNQVLTWTNGERNESRDGRAKIFLNSSNLQELHQNLRERFPEEWADFVIALRQFGPSQDANRSRSSSSSTVSPSNLNEVGYQPDFSVAPTYSLRSPLDLVSAVVEIPNPNATGSSNSSKRRLISPISDANAFPSNYLGRLLDNATTDARKSLPGRVDANHAPYWVLVAVPGMTSDLAERIIRQRQSHQSGNGRLETSDDGIPSNGTVAWLFEQGLVDLPQLTQLEPYMTARADVYSCQVVGYKDADRPVYRATVTVDACTPEPVIRELCTWHDWDRGFDVRQLRSTLLRSASAGRSATLPQE